jgi:hypothetical protein
MVSLQHDLTNLANEYNQQIKDIQNSKEPTEAKVAQIVFAINQGRTLANMAAAKWSGNVVDAMQRVLDAEVPGQSARGFAQAHGLDMGQMFRQPGDEKNLEEQVRGVLNKPGSGLGVKSGFDTPPHASPPTEGHSSPGVSGSATGTTGSSGVPGSATGTTSDFVSSPPTPPPSAGPQAAPAAAGSRMNLAGFSKTQAPTPAAPTPAPTATPMPSAPTSGLSHGGTSMGAPSLGAPSTGMTGAPTSPTAGSPSIAGGAPQPTTPGELMHSFDKGLQAGTPLPGAGAMPPPQVAPTDPQLAQQPRVQVSRRPRRRMNRLRRSPTPPSPKRLRPHK